jgi:hypothetical protein
MPERTDSIQVSKAERTLGVDIREILFCYDLEWRTHRSVERASQVYTLLV